MSPVSFCACVGETGAGWAGRVGACAGGGSCHSQASLPVLAAGWLWRGSYRTPGLQLVEGLGSDCLVGVVTENRRGHLGVAGLLQVSGAQVTSVLMERPVRGEGRKLLS